jgi:ABC-type multidrug transport system fused ATPase/permease subunit
MHVPIAHYRGLLDAYLRPQRLRVGLLALLLFGSIGLQLLNPQVIRYFIDTTQARGPQQALVGAALVFIVVGLAQRGVALAAFYVGANVGWAATNALRADLTRHCLRLDMSFHKRRTPGELIERIDGDITALANFFSQFIVHVAGNALLIVAVLLLLFREDWRVGVGLALYTAITCVALGAVQNLAVGRWLAQRQASAEFFGFLEERISGTEDIRANGAEPYIMRCLAGLLRVRLLRERSAQLVSNLTFAVTNVLFVIGYALGLAIGAYLYIQGAVSIGTAYLIVFYIGMLASPLEHIREQVQDLQRASASIQRIQELFRIQPHVREQIAAALPGGALAVAFASISFGYHDDQPANGAPATDELVLRDVSFQLQPGKVLGLLGRTGSGKTTLTRLLFRLYDPDAGALCLDGINIRDVALDDLRGRVGMVTQEVQLFQASIRDNLTLFNTRIDDVRIERALSELGLWEWVQSLPAGLDTQLAAGGQGLSAGEAQLLAFTRVFLNDPGLIILDEASSRLDPLTEHLLERAIARLLVGRTGIIIAHRLRTVQRADDIMIMEQGRIIEHGRREVLAGDQRSRFYELLQVGLEEALA